MTDVPLSASAPAATTTQASGTAPARLTVYRRSPDDARQRQVILSLDGAPLATLLYGQQVTREIPPGAHRLRANNTLVWKTVAFDAAPGGHVQFTIVNRGVPGLLGMIALLGAGPMYVTIDPVEAGVEPPPGADHP